MLRSLANKLGIHIIHLEHRHDREDLVNIWYRDVFQRDAVFFPATRASPGALGCLDSHKRLAQQNKHSAFLVLEDDAVPVNLTADLAFEVLQLLKDDSWDLLYLGGFPSHHILRPHTKHSFWGSALCTYAMIVRPRAANLIAEMDFRNGPIDVQLMKSNLRMLLLHEPLFTSADSSSDVNRSSRTSSKTFVAFVNQVSSWWRSVAFTFWRTDRIWMLVVALVVFAMWIKK